MNWLTSIVQVADKASFLKQKYLPMALKKAPQGDEDMRHRVVTTLDRIVEYGMRMSPKYAEWYVYQTLIRPAGTQGPILYDDKFGQVKDWLARGNGAIQSLKTPPEEVIAASDQWHAEMAAIEAQYRTNNVIAELSDGFKLVSVPEEDAQAEGHHMGHCVGSYCEEIKSGELEIFSLRDSQNEPHATIEALPVGSNEGKHYEIVQIKGKQNKPQPKYVKYVEETLNAMMQKVPLTLTNEGWMDYTGFQEDREKQIERLSVTLKQKHEMVHGDIFRIYQYGETPPTYEALETFVDSGSMDEWIKSSVETGSSTFQDYVIDNRSDDLADRARNLLDDGEITPEEFEDFVTDPATADKGILQEIIEVESQEAAEDEMFVRAYVLEEHMDDVTELFMAEEFPDFDDPHYEYEQWEKYFREKRIKQEREEKQARILRVIEQYGINVPPDLLNEVVHRAGYLRPNMQDDDWAQEIQGIVERKIRDRQEQEANWQKQNQKVGQWAQLLSQMFPEYVQLSEFDQASIVDTFRMKEVPDQQVYDYVQTYIENMRRKGALASSWRFVYKSG
jgi:hypothetical protein